MTMQERIANADEKIRFYWELMGHTTESNNEELYDYWLAKWAAACEIYEILIDEKWNPTK